MSKAYKQTHHSIMVKFDLYLLMKAYLMLIFGEKCSGLDVDWRKREVSSRIRAHVTQDHMTSSHSEEEPMCIPSQRGQCILVCIKKRS